MSGYVDIHSHVLPGIDDGPGDLDGALSMARAAAEAGTWTLAATPHLRADFPDVHVEELAERCQAVSQAIDGQGIPVRLVCAAEVSVVWALEADRSTLRLASFGQRGRDLLIETPLSGVIGLARHLQQLQARGYRITLAHPERAVHFQRDLGRLRDLADQGVLLQINADSLLTQDSRRGTRRLAETLCLEGLADVLASDGHRSTDWRPVTNLARAVEAAAGLVGPDRAEWMAREAPRAVVEGTALPDAPPVIEQRRRWRPFSRR